MQVILENGVKVEYQNCGCSVQSSTSDGIESTKMHINVAGVEVTVDSVTVKVGSVNGSFDVDDNINIKDYVKLILEEKVETA